MKKKGLVWLAVFVVAFLFGVIGNPVVASADTEEPLECSEWVWYYLTVNWEDENTNLHLLLVSYNAQHGHSNTKLPRCFSCQDIISVTYQTPSMTEPAAAAYECEEDSIFLRIEQEIEEDSADFWITIKGESAVSLQNYTLKWATNVCGGEVEWFNCEKPPTAVTLSYFRDRSLMIKLPRFLKILLSWFR